MPDVLDISDWVVDLGVIFRRAYSRYREMIDLIENEIRKHLPCWKVEVREHRHDSFEVLLCPPMKNSGAGRVIYLTSRQLTQVFDPDFKASPVEFFGFNLYEDDIPKETR